MKDCGNGSVSSERFEHDELLYPSGRYADPQGILNDQNLTLERKRATLALWASDACAVEGTPGSRRVPGSGRVVGVDEILEALCALVGTEGPDAHFRN